MKADLVIAKDKEEVVEAAWESFKRRDSLQPQLATRISEKEGFELGFKTGFYFALVALEQGALGAIKGPKQAGDN